MGASNSLKSQARKPESQRREYERFPMSLRDIQAIFEQPGGTISKMTVKAIDLSAGGMLVQSRGFVHPKIRCEIVLEDLTGRKLRTPALVRWCALGDNGQHEIGIEFEERVDPRRIIDPGVVTAALEKSGDADEKAIVGTVLIVDDQEIDRTLAQMHLSELGVTVLDADSVDSAVNKFIEQPIDVLITDYNLGSEGGGAELVNAFRGKGFLGEIILMTGEATSPADNPQEKVRPTVVLDKPYRPGDLLTALTACLGRVQMPTSDEPIYSNLEQVLSLSKPVQIFIDSAKSKAEEMSKAVEASDLEAVKAAVRVLYSNGEGFGFPDVTKAARSALKGIDATMSLEESHDAIRRLNAIVQRLKLRPKQNPMIRH